jgi:hypothetical protein
MLQREYVGLRGSDVRMEYSEWWEASEFLLFVWNHLTTAVAKNCCAVDILNLAQILKCTCELMVLVWEKIYEFYNICDMVLPRPARGLGGVIVLCWAKPRCPHYVGKKLCYVYAKAYGALHPRHLNDALFLTLRVYTVLGLLIAYETAISRNPQSSSNCDSRITGQLGYKHTFCQNVVSTKKIACPYIFVET